MTAISDDLTVAAAVRALATGLPDREHSDCVAVEAPLEVRIGGQSTTILMRTPGSDEELVRGFLFSEGMIAQANDVIAITQPIDLAESERGFVLDVELADPNRAPIQERLFFSNSSCGVCGKMTLAALDFKANPSKSKLTVRRGVLSTLPERMRAAQPAFAKTGGLHASGLFTPDGELVVVREDVGRHNALDKVVGWALAEGLIPLDDYLLLVSGRVSYEIVQKAAAASMPFIAAVGAPSSLAIELAERFNLTLVGFLRADSMNVYANAFRLVE